MTDELENALAEEFPFMRWVPEDGGRWIGIFCDCEDGWYPLIREMCREITTSFEKTGAPADIVVEQVKQKYGELRFYFRPNNPLYKPSLTNTRTGVARSARFAASRAASGRICFGYRRYVRNTMRRKSRMRQEEGG